MNKNNTLKELEHFCNQNQFTGALLLTGEWGSGKTYLLDHDFKKMMGDKFCLVRVSLFGLTEANEIKSAAKQEWFKVWIQVHTKTNKLDKSQDIANNIKKYMNDVQDDLPSGMKTAVKYVGAIDFFTLIEIKPVIKNKKVVMIFDDLERCKADVIDVLGVVNDYCENKKICTIVVANENKIKKQSIITKQEKNDDSVEAESQSNQKSQFCQNSNTAQIGQNNKEIVINCLSYTEMKEKIIQRTIYYQPFCSEIIDDLLKSIDYKTYTYRSFIFQNKDRLVAMLDDNKAEGYKENQAEKVGLLSNLRSLKSAILDFYRIFVILRKNDIKNMHLWFLEFVAYFLIARDLGIYKSDYISKSIISGEVSKCFEDFQKSYMLDTVETWLLSGDWNEEQCKEEIERIKIREQGLSPVDRIRTTSLALLDEEVIEAGWNEYLKHAYEGNLDFNDYVQLIRNSWVLREISVENRVNC